jgi:type II secretory pathway pseudopilin PulG
MHYAPLPCLAPLSAVRPREATNVSGKRTARFRSRRALTLVEVMVAMTLMATVMLGFIGTFLQSRRLTESSVLHAAASSLMYGIIEQIKGVDYTTLLPCTGADPDGPAEVQADPPPPYLRIRINQDITKWVKVIYTAKGSSPKGPTSTPPITAKAADVGAIDNYLGALPLSTVTGTTSQDLSLNLWVWIDEIPDTGKDVSEVKKVTIVYTYSYLDGGTERIVRSREVFLRTRYEQ